MRRLGLVVIAAVAVGGPTDAHADCFGCGDHYETAVRPAEIAYLENRLVRLDHMGRVRRIRAEIEYSEAVVESLRRRLRDYSRVNVFVVGNALDLSEERVELALRREEILVRELREQLVLEQRAYYAHKRAHAAAAQQSIAAGTQAAAVRPAAGEPTIVIINH
ncbi:hypothetical protein [Botrimarina sp.]|uniref:hypothetical protein n=1 Tax=Botrimarina sp. TaxID=2795802 RepID=UPI0032EEF30F